MATSMSAAAARAERAALAHPDLVPGRQALDVRRKDVARRDRHAHAQDRAREHEVGARRARAVHVGETDHEIVDGFDRHGCPAWAMSMVNFCMSQAPVGQRSAHRPQCRQRSSSFTITRRLFTGSETRIAWSRLTAGAFSERRSFVLRRVRHEGDAVDRADVDAGVALDAGGRREDGLDVAVEAAPRFGQRLLEREAELDLGAQVPERRGALDLRHDMAAVERDGAVVGPLVQTHLLADEIGHRRRAVAKIPALAPGVDRHRRLVAVRDRGDDVLRAERRVAAEEDAGHARGEGDRIDRRACRSGSASCRDRPRSRERRSPGRRRPARRRRGSRRRARRSERAARRPCSSFSGRTFSKTTPVSLPASWVKALRHEVVQDLDALVDRVLLLPGRGLHLVVARAHDDLDLLAAEPSRAAAAVHRGVAAAEHDDAPADRVGVAEEHARQPLDADADVARRFAPARERRDRARAARRSRRRSRRSLPASSALRLVIRRAATNVPPVESA